MSVFWALGQILERAMLSGQREQMRRLLGAISSDPDLSPMLQKMIDTQASANSWPVVIGLALLTPLFSFLFIYLNAAVTHGFALLLGQSKRGFPATFAACAYACAPLVLLAVPACGSIVGVVWLVVLTGIGLKETHRISTGGAAATVLTPYDRLPALDMSSAKIQEGLQITLKIVMRMRRVTDEGGARLLIVLIPTKESVFEGRIDNVRGAGCLDVLQHVVSNERIARGLIVEELQREGMAYVDVLPALRAGVAAGTERLYLRSSDSHPNQWGYRAIATAIAASLGETFRKPR